MNLLSIFLVTFLSATLILYFLFSRSKFKKLTETLISFQLAGQKLNKEHNILVDQYRQLANINTALRSITNSKSKK